jgi:hypothetical protein
MNIRASMAKNPRKKPKDLAASLFFITFAPTKES